MAVLSVRQSSVRWRLILLLSPLSWLLGCHSAYVNASVQNLTSEPISLVELDYPSASFGTQSLAPGEVLNYRFKVLGSGDLKLLWTDSHHQDRHADGPHLSEGAEGLLQVQLTHDGVRWTAPAKR